jgi:aminoglycoside phosphotransferase (APT) family kinase protein
MSLHSLTPLPARSALLNRGRARGVLQRACAASPWDVLEVNSVKLVKERAGRKRTLRYEIKARRPGEDARDVRWYGKQRAGTRGARLFEIMRYLHPAASAELRVPEAMAHSPEARLVLIEELEGTPLVDFMARAGEDETRDVLRRLGQTVAALHEIRPPSRDASGRPLLRRHGSREEAMLLELAAERMADAEQPPQIIARFRRVCAMVLEAVTRKTGDRGGSPCLLHRDLHPGQVIVGEEGLGLIGFDHAAIGEAEVDLGNLVANFILWDHQREGAEPFAPARTRSLLSGYRSRRRADRERLASYTASALLRLAAVERVADPRVSRLGWPLLSWALIEESLSIYRTALA